MQKFENFLCAKNDRIDNAAHALLDALLSRDAETEQCVEWNMQHIGEATMLVERYLAEHGQHACHPFYTGEGDTPCYQSEMCLRKDCPYKK